MTDPASLPAGPDRLRALVEAGRIAHHRYRGTDAEGRETLCWLAALSDEVADSEDPCACPGEVAPEWLAHLIPALDDGVPDEARPALGLRLAETARGLHLLSPEASERARVEVLRRILDEAVSHVTVDEWGVRDAVAGVRAALRGEATAWAAWAAWAGAAAAAARAARAAGAARAAAWERIATMVLDVLDAEIAKAR